MKNNKYKLNMHDCKMRIDSVRENFAFILITNKEGNGVYGRVNYNDMGEIIETLKKAKSDMENETNDCTTKNTKSHEGQPQRMNVREIITKYLKDNGYDGLYYNDECGCELKELITCGNVDEDCKPGHKIKCDPDTCINGGGCAWHIGPKTSETSVPSEAEKENLRGSS